MTRRISYKKKEAYNGDKNGRIQLLDKDSGPYGITAGKDGALWFTQHKANQIGRITVNGEVTPFVVPTPNAGVLSITSTTQGMYGLRKIGRIKLEN